MFPQVQAAAAALKTAAGMIAVAILLLTGATGGWSVAWLWAERWTIPDAETAAADAATAAADRKWQKKLDEAEDAARIERIQKQVEIDRAAQSYLKQIGARDAAMTALEAQLAKEREENAIPSPTPAPGGAGACRPAISRGVRDQLDRIGRTDPG